MGIVCSMDFRAKNVNISNQRYDLLEGHASSQMLQLRTPSHSKSDLIWNDLLLVRNV